MEAAELVAECESQSLHLTGAIQPHGALIVIDGQGVISHASANLHSFTGLAPAEILGRDAATSLPFLPGDCLKESLPPFAPGIRLFRPQLFRPQLFRPMAVALDGERPEMTALASVDGSVLIEFRREETARRPPLLMEKHAFSMMRPPTDEAGLGAFYENAAILVRDAIGYDRALVYRFLPDWSGEVVAEVGGNDGVRYKGLRFPASDIPESARDLYLVTGQRLIPETGAKPVPMLAAIDGAAPPDLTHSDLRSVAPVHMDYLRNMQVGASYSLAISVMGKLWGLIACHNDTPKGVDLASQARCVDFARGFGIGLTAYHSTRRMQFLDSIDHRLEALVENLSAYKSSAEGFLAHSADILDLMRASGGAVLFRSHCLLFGATPDEAAIRALDCWYREECAEDFMATDHLAAHFPDGEGIADHGAGVIAMRVQPSRISHAVVRAYVFRPELPRIVHWAGNPEKRVAMTDSKTLLGPRTSFAEWSETTRHKSAPWSPIEEMAARKFRSNVLRWWRD